MTPTRTCQHLSRLDRFDGLSCSCRTRAGIRPASGPTPPAAHPERRTTTGTGLPWAALLILTVTAFAVTAALIVGLRWQDQRCAAAADTPTACTGWSPAGPGR